MKNYSAMNTMQCFSSNNSLSNSSKDSKQMFLTTRREPLIPTSNYLNHLQNQSVINQSQVAANQNYPCVHPHHTVLSSSCSPSISSNSINIWTTINNSTGIKQNDKVPAHYSALTTLGKLNTLHSNLHHNKPDDLHHKNVRWRTNERRFCYLLLAIGCILTFILLIFSLVFYFIVFKQGVSFGLDFSNDKLTNNNNSLLVGNNNLVNSGFRSNHNNLNNNNLRPDASSQYPYDRIKLEHQQPKKKRKRLINKIEGEMRIINKPFKVKNYEDEVALIKQNLNYFISRSLSLCLNNTEITQYRRGDNHDLNGIIVNFVLTFNCALPNLAKRLAFSMKDSFKGEYLVDFRTLRLTPIFDSNHMEFVDVIESDSEHWLKFAKNSEWDQWSDWSTCDCSRSLVVKSRQRKCFNKTINKSASNFSCGNSDEDNDEHLPSLEIRNCDCDFIDPQQSSSQSTSSSNVDATNSLHSTICAKCEKTTEICLSYNAHMPNCLKISNYEDPCGGHCNNGKGTECKFLEEKNMYQCLHLNETSSSDSNSCLDDEFRCADGLCIPNIKYCDGLTNCFDNSDEINCQCDIQSGEYMHCGNSTSCIHINKRCDYVADCWDNSDEKNCFQNCPLEDEETNVSFFHCSSGNKECIPTEQKCNGVRNCLDGSDEIDCVNKNNLHRN